LRETLNDHPVSLALPDDPPPVLGDEVLLEQVLSNLLENAAKHTPAGTAVEISAKVSGDMFEVGVRDHGPGLAPGEEERVFEKFHQSRPEGAQSGFGLGLAICKAIVEAHGGTISARNAPGGGAEFRFSLPLQTAESARA
jgi:two-component system sensor histidine kinase KdpD